MVNENLLTNNLKLLIGNWNRIIVEILQAQPQGLEVGSSSARVWINGTNSSWVYFGNFASGDTTVSDGSSAGFEICGVYDSASPHLVSSNLGGYFDVLNLVWFQGAQSLFPDTTSKRN